MDSICTWGKTSFLIGSEEHQTIPTLTLFDILTGPNLTTITDTNSLALYIRNLLNFKYLVSNNSNNYDPKKLTSVEHIITDPLSTITSVLIWAGRSAGFSLQDARNLGRFFAPFVDTKIITSANSISNFSPSSSFLDLNTDIFPTNETDHLDLVEGTVRVGNHSELHQNLSDSGSSNIRTFIIATLRTHTITQFDEDNFIFPPLNILHNFPATTPPFTGVGDDPLVNLNLILIRVQSTKADTLKHLLSNSPSVRAFGSVPQSRTARWVTLQVLPSGVDPEGLASLLKLNHVYSSPLKNLFTPSTSPHVISIKCQGSKVYTRDSPCHLTILSAFRNKRNEAPVSVYPTSDFSVRIALKEEGDVKELLTFLKKANLEITPPIFHSYRTGDVMASLHEKKFTPPHANFTQTRRHAPPGNQPGHYIILHNLPLFSNIDSWLKQVTDAGVVIKDTFITRNNDYEHQTIIQTTTDPREILGFDRHNIIINNLSVDAAYSSSYEHKHIIQKLDPKQILHSLRMFDPVDTKSADPMMASFLAKSSRKTPTHTLPRRPTPPPVTLPSTQTTTRPTNTPPHSQTSSSSSSSTHPPAPHPSPSQLSSSPSSVPTDNPSQQKRRRKRRRKRNNQSESSTCDPSPVSPSSLPPPSPSLTNSTQ